MPRTALRRITLTDFRSYEHVRIDLDGRPVVLSGPNGAGKTNLLEAISLLIPGRGLRNAAISEIGRREPGEGEGRAWAVAAEVAAGDQTIAIGTGPETAGDRKSTRLNSSHV